MKIDLAGDVTGDSCYVSVIDSKFANNTSETSTGGDTFFWTTKSVDISNSTKCEGQECNKTTKSSIEKLEITVNYTNGTNISNSPELESVVDFYQKKTDA